MKNHRDVLAFAIALVFIVIAVSHGYLAYNGATWAALGFMAHVALAVGGVAGFMLFWWLSKEC